jgi:hypothetical protein
MSQNVNSVLFMEFWCCIVQKSTIKSYFFNDPCLGTSVFVETIEWNRFDPIMKFLHILGIDWKYTCMSMQQVLKISPIPDILNKKS